MRKFIVNYICVISNFSRRGHFFVLFDFAMRLKNRIQCLFSTPDYPDPIVRGIYPRLFIYLEIYTFRVKLYL